MLLLAFLCPLLILCLCCFLLFLLFATLLLVLVLPPEQTSEQAFLFLFRSVLVFGATTRSAEAADHGPGIIVVIKTMAAVLLLFLVTLSILPAANSRLSP